MAEGETKSSHSSTRDLKLDLARRMPDDREGYTSAKTAFISRVDTHFCNSL